DFPTYSWSVEAGDLLDNQKSLVRWIAPDISKVYQVSVTVANSVSTKSRSEDVFVTNSATVVPSFGGELHLIPGQNAFYYLYSANATTSEAFQGFTIRRWQNGSDQAITSAMPGLGYVFSTNLAFAAHSYEDISEIFDKNPYHIVIDALPAGTQTVITNDEAADANRRRNQYTNPSISPDGALVAFQAFKASVAPPEQGGVDTFNVNVYNTNTFQTTRLVTGSSDFFPSFSSDGGYLTFISNRNGISGWELFAFPVSGGTVDTLAAHLVKMSSTGGLLASGSPPTKPLMAWNPVDAHPFLAIVGADKKLRLVGTNGTSDAVQGLSGTVTGMAWSSDGTKLAVSTGYTIYSVDLTRTAQVLHASLPSDAIDDLAWIDGDGLILYNIKRLGSTWFELIDVGSSADVTGALKVTPKVLARGIADYRTVCSLRAVWKSNAETYAPVFFNDTPGVLKMNLSGLFD
ncbi:MAG: PD40 domain-containing protein, partial [Chitinivibrionia bacterium]|nr:PD40 domain-containing protein [Chitinivibrionia bacterium]